MSTPTPAGTSSIKDKVTKREAKKKANANGAKGVKNSKAGGTAKNGAKPGGKPRAAKPSKNIADLARETDAEGNVVRLSDQVIGLHRPHRFKPGKQAEREIKRMQKEVKLILPRAAVERIVREVLASEKDNAKLSEGAVKVIHHGVESMLVDLMAETQSLAELCDVETIDKPHMRKAADYLLRRPRKANPLYVRRSPGWYRRHPGEAVSSEGKAVMPSKSRAKPLVTEPDATDESTVG